MSIMSGRAWKRRDILVTVTLALLLLCLGVVAVAQVRERSRRYGCSLQLHRLGTALQSFHDRQGTYPPAYVSNLAANGLELGPGWGWMAFLLPDLGRADLYLRMDFAQDVRAMTWPGLEVSECPGSAGPKSLRLYDRFQEESWEVPTVSYVAVNGNLPVREAVGKNDGVFLRNRPCRSADVSDGLSQTLFLGERRAELLATTWLGSVPRVVLARSKDEPPDYGMALVTGNCGTHLPDQPRRGNRAGFGGHHRTATPFLLGDGSVRFLAASIKAHVYAALASRASGEPAASYAEELP